MRWCCRTTDSNASESPSELMTIRPLSSWLAAIGTYLYLLRQCPARIPLYDLAERSGITREAGSHLQSRSRTHPDGRLPAVQSKGEPLAARLQIDSGKDYLRP